MNRESTLHFRYQPKDDNIVLIGGPRSGKTHLVKHLIIPLLKGPTWVWYPEEREDRLPQFVTSLGWPVVSTVEDLPYGKALVYPSDRSLTQFENFCAKADSHTNLTLIVDEAEYYVGKYKIRSPSFERIVNGGRPKGLCWICIARRPQQLHNDILHAATHVFCFEFNLPGDIEFMSKWTGPKVWGFIPPDQRKPAYRNLPMIPEHGFVYWSKDEGHSEVGRL